MIAAFAAPATWVDIFAAASALVLIVWSATLIAAIGLGVSERSARRANGGIGSAVAVEDAVPAPEAPHGP